MIWMLFGFLTGLFAKECFPAQEDRPLPTRLSEGRLFFSGDGRYVLGGRNQEEVLWDFQTNSIVGDRDSAKWLVQPSGDWIVSRRYRGSPSIRSLRQFAQNQSGVELLDLGDPVGVQELERTAQFARVLWILKGGGTVELKLHLNGQGDVARVERQPEVPICQSVWDIGHGPLNAEQAQTLRTQLAAAESELLSLSQKSLALERLRRQTTNESLRSTYATQYSEFDQSLRAKGKEVGDLTTRLNGKRLPSGVTVRFSPDGKHFSWYNADSESVEILKQEGNHCKILRRGRGESLNAGLSLSREAVPATLSYNNEIWLRSSDSGSPIRVPQSGGIVREFYGFNSEGRIYGIFRDPDTWDYKVRLWDPYQLQGTAEEKQERCLEKSSTGAEVKNDQNDQTKAVK